MDISRNGGDIAFRTPFSATQDLVQILRGLAPGDPSSNNPVDFRLAGLQRRGHGDIWHVDQVLAFSTDECAPMVINGEDIGGNHGHPCGVRIHAPAHGRDSRDVGSLWRDDKALLWTLVRVEDENRMLFLSENTGASQYGYAFASRVSGTLRYVSHGMHTQPVAMEAQEGMVQLTPAIRHLKREAVCLSNGRWQPVDGWHEGCECAEIREVYEIINPATVAEALRKNRPAGGYAQQPSLAVGEGMVLHRMTYRILADGTILCDFDHETLQPVRLTHYLGIMAQERCDVFGGGVWREIPGIRPFADHGHRFDFSKPYPISAGPMPDWRSITPDLWEDPLCPPGRQLDYFLRPDGSCAVVFECGFLPVYDGEPAKRASNITDAWEIVPSCKAYPTFAGGKDGKMVLNSLRGVGCKKYRLPGKENDPENPRKKTITCTQH